jgi:hypothetical protein
MRRGLALIEVALAFVILGLAIVPILNLFFGTSRLQRRTTSAFREAVAGQLVWEAIKGRNVINPHMFRDLPTTGGFEAREVPHPQAPDTNVLGFVHFGAFVERDGPVDDAGNPLPLSPFAQQLMNRTEMSAPEVASLHKNFQDLAVRIVIADALVPAWRPGAGQVVPAAKTELVKDVVVEVFRMDLDRRLPALPAFRLVTSLETPNASLSVSALRELRRSTDDYKYERELAVAAEGVRAGLADTPMGRRMHRVGADLVLISVESVGESVLSDGRDLGFGIQNGDTGKGSEYLVTELSRIEGPVARLAAADLLAEQSRGIFQAYRRSEQPIRNLYLYVREFSPRLRRVVRALTREMREFRRADGSDAPEERAAAKERVRELATAHQRTLVQLGFWAQLYQQPRWFLATVWPLTYPGRYARALARAQALYREAEAHPRATPMDRIRAINGFLEVAKARKMYEAAPSIAEDEEWLRPRIERYAATLKPYADGLRGDDYWSYPALAARNDEFVRVLASMREWLPLNGRYAVALRTLHPQGRLQDYRQNLNQVFEFFGLPEFNGAINRDIGTLVNQVRQNEFPDPPGLEDPTDPPPPPDDGVPDEEPTSPPLPVGG